MDLEEALKRIKELENKNATLESKNVTLENKNLNYFDYILNDKAKK